MRRDKRIFALGFFDGVHLGHQELLRQCVRLARELDCQTAAITFDAHPKTLFSADVPPLINTVEDRCLLLRRYGIGTICRYPVVKEVMAMPWRDFLEELMAQGAAGFVCGDDFSFGNRGEGNGEKLQEFCRERDLPCVIVPEQTEDGIRVSSTHIRALIEDGKMETAARFLGHPHLLSGTVIHGHQLGRTLGIPTANLLLPAGVVVPKFGVYACLAEVGGKKYPAVANVGTRPTVSGRGITVEPWILDFEGDLYGRELRLEFYRFLRPEQKFPDLAALQAEIRKNAVETRDYFGK
ncbi:MAG: riboflavin biosynthesis protein RibF [Oscillospiraceae bacterium]|nr:riboflavin biosynthesis protein RibF [Oscillospiraceae bacterium]